MMQARPGVVEFLQFHPQVAQMCSRCCLSLRRDERDGQVEERLQVKEPFEALHKGQLARTRVTKQQHVENLEHWPAGCCVDGQFSVQYKRFWDAQAVSQVFFRNVSDLEEIAFPIHKVQRRRFCICSSKADEEVVLPVRLRAHQELVARERRERLSGKHVNFFSGKHARLGWRAEFARHGALKLCIHRARH